MPIIFSKNDLSFLTYVKKSMNSNLTRKNSDTYRIEECNLLEQILVGENVSVIARKMFAWKEICHFYCRKQCVEKLKDFNVKILGINKFSIFSACSQTLLHSSLSSIIRIENTTHIAFCSNSSLSKTFHSLPLEAVECTVDTCHGRSLGISTRKRTCSFLSLLGHRAQGQRHRRSCLRSESISQTVRTTVPSTSHKVGGIDIRSSEQRKGKRFAQSHRHQDRCDSRRLFNVAEA